MAILRRSCRKRQILSSGKCPLPPFPEMSNAIAAGCLRRYIHAQARRCCFWGIISCCRQLITTCQMAVVGSSACHAGRRIAAGWLRAGVAYMIRLPAPVVNGVCAGAGAASHRSLAGSALTKVMTITVRCAVQIAGHDQCRAPRRRFLQDARWILPRPTPTCAPRSRRCMQTMDETARV